MEYISVANQKALGQHFRLAAIQTLAFLVTVGMFMLVARFLSVPDIVPGSEQWLRPVYAAVLALSLAVVVLRRVMLSQLLARAHTKAVSTVLNGLQRLSLTCAVVAEVVAIVGLAAYLLTGEYHYSWRLGVISLLLLLYSLPRRWEWERAVIASAQGSSGA